MGVKYSVRRKNCIFRSKILSLEVEFGCLVVIGKISLLYLNVWTISSISDPLVGGRVDFMYGILRVKILSLEKEEFGCLIVSELGGWTVSSQ